MAIAASEVATAVARGANAPISSLEESVKFIDIGVNFHSKQLHGKTDEVVSRAKAAGVVAILATGTSLESSRSEHYLARRFPGYLYSTAGVHPHSADAWSDAMREALELLWHDPAVVAIGETGLDFNRNFSTPANQRKAFEAQLDAAARIRKPLFLHCRDAFDVFYPMVREAVQAGAHGVVHCFTGTLAEAEAFVDLGLDIGVTGWVTDLNRGQDLRQAVTSLSLERLHLETDAPYLGPKNAGKRKPYNEPANLVWVARAIAELRGIDVQTVADTCTRNSQALFGLADHSCK
ncbi:TatD family deoxyribonuclease (plasmid) [Paraburkholderia pallida]|uniref:TatD family deoxyribonuclease n=1 Tax=Paraburkholderia pallida TaxID=2547399 RepID=A0A4P7D726_9BURK|nr:TatD family deoxyribonuclease [Paraburkholderia pallida]